ncbi:MAG: amidohydrolase family protein [Chloroflexota bacterium]
MKLIDCDIHNTMPSNDSMSKYLSSRWKRHLDDYGLRSYFSGGYYHRSHANAARDDAWPPNGNIPASDLAFVQEQLLDHWQIDIGILNTLYAAGEQSNRHFGAAMATAINEWVMHDWLEPEPRFRGSIVIPYEDGALAAEEINRWAAESRFIQVSLVCRTQEPLGRRKYWPIYEAAVEHDLPIGIHFGGAPGLPITGAGYPSFYFEDHCGMPQAFQAQLISYIFEGVFERFPTLKIVLIEGGFGWLPSLMWRMDRVWEKLGCEVPEVKRPPSDYIRQHFWFTTQPMEEPTQNTHFHQLLADIDMPDRIMFATDYPHWDFDAPDEAFPVKLDKALHHKIMVSNAQELYQL